MIIMVPTILVNENHSMVDLIDTLRSCGRWYTLVSNIEREMDVVWNSLSSDGALQPSCGFYHARVETLGCSNEASRKPKKDPIECKARLASLVLRYGKDVPGIQLH